MSMKTESITRILRIEGRVPEETDIWFRPSNEARAFHCPTCGAFQFYHQHRAIALVQDDMSQVLNTPPISIQCKKCGHIFHVRVL